MTSMMSFMFQRCLTVSQFKIFRNNGNSVYKPLFQWLSLLHSISKPFCNWLSLVHLLFLSLSGLAGVVLGQVVGELLVWRLGEGSLLPQVRGQVRISVGNGNVGCFCYKKPKVIQLHFHFTLIQYKMSS